MTEETDYTSRLDPVPQVSLSSEESKIDLSVNLIDVLAQLVRRKWLVAAGTGLGFLGGLVLCLVRPVNYTAATKIMPPQQTQSGITLFTGQSAAGGTGLLSAATALNSKSPNDIYVGLLTSRPIADAIIQRFGLAKVYNAKNPTIARSALASNTQVILEKSGFITVYFSDGDKKRAAEIANAYASELRILLKTLAVSEASQRRLFYEDQLMQAKDALVAAEVSFQQVQLEKGLVQLGAQASAVIGGLTSLRAQVAAKQVEVQALRLSSTELNPELQLAERQLSSLQEEVVHMEQRNHSHDSAYLGMADVPVAGLEYLRAEHEVSYRQIMFDLLIKQYDAARLDEAKEAAVIQVVEPAIEPDSKPSPIRTRFVLFTTTVGFIAGCLLALFLWWKDTAQSAMLSTRWLRALEDAHNTTVL